MKYGHISSIFCKLHNSNSRWEGYSLSHFRLIPDDTTARVILAGAKSVRPWYFFDRGWFSLRSVSRHDR